MILLRTKPLLLGWGVINFHCTYDQRALTVPYNLKIPFICNITLTITLTHTHTHTNQEKPAVSSKFCF